MKTLVMLLLLGVVISLGSALFSMSSKNGSSQRMLNALALRVAISVGLIVVLVVSWQMGYIEPRGAG